MFGKLIAIVIVFLAVYGIVSCELSDREKKKAEEKISAQRKSEDIKLWQIIKDKKSQHAAETKWINALGFLSAKSEFRELYTSEIQNAFLSGKPILIFGNIEDTSNFDASNYQIKISLTSFSLQMLRFVKPRLEFQMICNKKLIDDLMQELRPKYRGELSFQAQVAVISEIKEISDFSYQVKDEHLQKGKTLIGDCKEILLAPRERQFLRENLKDLYSE